MVDWGGTVDIVKRASDGEAADIVIVPDSRVSDLVKRGVIFDRVDLARSGIGIALSLVRYDYNSYSRIDA